jgi:hypothetical protein
MARFFVTINTIIDTVSDTPDKAEIEIAGHLIYHTNALRFEQPSVKAERVEEVFESMGI